MKCLERSAAAVMTPTRLMLVMLCLIAQTYGCAHVIYEQTKIGSFKGALDIHWIKPDRFIYVPNKDDPLRFTVSGRTFEPRAMYTDGGSIPRLFWGVPNYSPWGYAPAYIIHDWLFDAHHCGDPEYIDISFERSAEILAEGIKTLMETGVAPRDKTTLWSIFEAVKSSVALSIWETGSCDRPALKLLEDPRNPPGELLMRIDINAIPRRKP